MPNSVLQILRTWEGVVAVSLCIIAIIAVGLTAYDYLTASAKQKQTTEPVQVSKKGKVLEIPSEVLEAAPKEIASINSGLAINSSPAPNPTPPANAPTASPPPATCNEEARRHYVTSTEEKSNESMRIYKRMNAYAHIYYGSKGFKHHGERDDFMQRNEKEHNERLALYQSELQASLTSIGCI